MRASWESASPQTSDTRPQIWSLPVSKQKQPLGEAYRRLNAALSHLERCVIPPSSFPSQETTQALSLASDEASPLPSALLPSLVRSRSLVADTVLFWTCPVEDDPSIDLIGWLCAYNPDARIFWSDRKRVLTCAGLGTALDLVGEQTDLVLQKVQSFLQDAPPLMRFWGGQSFDPSLPLPAPWRVFSLARWTLPRVTLTQEEGSLTLALALHLAPSTDPLEQIAAQRRSIDEDGLLSPPRTCSPPPFSPYPATMRQDTPALPQWKDTIARAKDSFAQGSLEKIVLARETKLTLQLHHSSESSELSESSALSGAPFSTKPFALLAALRAQATETYLFALQPTRDTVFLGASPERLYARSGDVLWSEALAGTRPRRADPAQDQQLGEELLASPKDRYEQLLVIRALGERFGDLCRELAEIPAPALRKLKYVQHLWTPIQGHLRPDVDDAAILRLLHPTPAVGGRPRETALALLREFERFGRGWYAAPVGWMGAQGAEIAVAIRSALLAQQQLFLYTGAGIVPDSDAEMEWRELEQKLKTFWEFVDCIPDSKPQT